MALAGRALMEGCPCVQRSACCCPSLPLTRSFIKSCAIKTKQMVSAKVRCVPLLYIFSSRQQRPFAEKKNIYIAVGAFCMEIADGACTLSARWIMSGRLLQIVMGANPRAPLCKKFKRRLGLEVFLRPSACLSFCNHSDVLCYFQNVILPPARSASALLQKGFHERLKGHCQREKKHKCF